MVRKQDTIQVVELPEETEQTPQEEENEAIEQNIMAAFDSDPANIIWDCKVYKINRMEGNAEDYLFSVLPSELDGLLDRLRDSEGTGVYRIRVYRRAEGKNRLFRQFDRRIKAPVKAPTPQEKQSELSAVLAAMEKNNERMIAVITTALNRQPQNVAPVSPPDPFALMTQMAGAMGTMMQALRPAEGASSTDLILKGVELANKLERGGGETNLFDLVKEALAQLPTLAQLSEGQRPAQPLPAPIQPLRVPAPTGTPINPNPSQVMTPEVQMQQQIRNALLGLIPKAQKGSDPSLFAELIADDFGIDAVTAIISQPNVLSQLQILVPEIGSYLPWFQTLLAALTELVNDARAAASGSLDASGKPHSPVNPLRNTGWSGGGEGDFEDNE